MKDSNTGMQKKIVGIILPVLAISVSSALLVLVLTHHFPYSQNGSYDKNSFNNLPNPPFSTGRYSISSISYQTFQDPVYGIKIQYPSDWEKIQFDKNFIVGFVSDARNDSGVLENLMISANRLPSPDISLNDFGKMRISALESQYLDFHLVSSGAFVTSTDSPLYKIEYNHKDGVTPITTTEIWALNGGRAFMLLANVDTSETSIYMPIFQKMINSFSSSAPANVLHNTKIHSV
jgi:hypothetical protein